MKILHFDGHLAANAEVKETSKGTKYLHFRVACDTFIFGENKTDWFDVTCFNEGYVTAMAPYLKKGSYVYVVGVPVTKVNTGSDGRVYVNTSVRADSINFLSGGGGKKENGDAAKDEPEIKVSAAPEAQPQPQPQATDYAQVEQMVSQPVQVQVTTAEEEDDEELPF